MSWRLDKPKFRPIRNATFRTVRRFSENVNLVRDDVKWCCYVISLSRDTHIEPGITKLEWASDSLKNIVKPEALCYDETSRHEAFFIPFRLVIHQEKKTETSQKSSNFKGLRIVWWSPEGWWFVMMSRWRRDGIWRIGGGRNEKPTMEDDNQRTWHFSTKSRSKRLSLNKDGYMVSKKM